MPVHRVPGNRGGVFAYTHQLDRWLHSTNAANGSAADLRSLEGDNSQTGTVAGEPEKEESLPSQSPDIGAETVRRRPLKPIILALSAVAIAACVLLGLKMQERSIESAAQRNRAVTPAARHVPGPAVRELYLNGIYYWNHRSEGSLNQALESFTRVTALDPSYAEAYAGVAESYDLMPNYSSMPKSEAYSHAIAAAEKAIVLDNSLAAAHRSLAFALFWWHWDVQRATAEFQSAIQLDPNDAEAHHWFAMALLQQHDCQHVKPEIERALQLEPTSRAILADQYFAEFRCGDRAAAIARLEEMERLEPDYTSPPRYLAEFFYPEGNYPLFIYELKRSTALAHDGLSAALAQAAAGGWRTGREKGLLEAMLKMQLKYYRAGNLTAADVAQTYALLGSGSEAVNYLQISLATKDYLVVSALDNGWARGRLIGYPPYEQLRTEIRRQLGIKA